MATRGTVLAPNGGAVSNLLSTNTVPSSSSSSSSSSSTAATASATSSSSTVATSNGSSPITSQLLANIPSFHHSTLKSSLTPMLTALSIIQSAPSIRFSLSQAILNALPQLIQKSGWLSKEGEIFRNWKRRFFRLIGTTLVYYSNQEDPHSLKGVVFLSGCQVKDWPLRKCAFEIVPAQAQKELAALTSPSSTFHTLPASPNSSNASPLSTANSSSSSSSSNGSLSTPSTSSSSQFRSYYIQADSEKEKDEWMRVIQNNIDYDSNRDRVFMEEIETWQRKHEAAERKAEEHRVEKELHLLKTDQLMTATAANNQQIVVTAPNNLQVLQNELENYKKKLTHAEDDKEKLFIENKVLKDQVDTLSKKLKSLPFAVEVTPSASPTNSTSPTSSSSSVASTSVASSTSSILSTDGVSADTTRSQPSLSVLGCRPCAYKDDRIRDIEDELISLKSYLQKIKSDKKILKSEVKRLRETYEGRKNITATLPAPLTGQHSTSVDSDKP